VATCALPDPLLDLTERLGEPGPSPQFWLPLTILAGVPAVVALADANAVARARATPLG
jgi:hypothetical protein